MNQCVSIRMLVPILLLACFASRGTLEAQGANRPPNIILIFTDDQGYQDLGCFGSKKIKTPHLDQMATEGVRLTSFYAQPVCGVSRAALMTGSYPIRVAEPGNIKRLHTVPHPNEVTMAEVLKKAGYSTGMMGKWHLALDRRDKPTGVEPATMPNAQGFDYFYGTPKYNGFTVYVNEHRIRSPLMRNNKIVVKAVESWDRITADYTSEAIKWIESNTVANPDKPFFLYLAHNMPHIPLGASEKFKGKSAGGFYGDTIEEIDWSCGEILKTLKELGIDDNTLVIFTSDNGPWVETTHGMKPGGNPFIPRDHSGNADPFRGWKMSAWEGGVRVPFIARWPGKIPAGWESDELLSTLDLLPTFATIANAQLPKVELDGMDASEFLTRKSKTSPRDEYLYYSGCLLTGVRSGQWKLVLPRLKAPKGLGWWGRMIEAVPTTLLFNLDDDPGETKSVAKANPDVVASLMKRITRARTELGDIDRTGQGARFFEKGPRKLQVPIRRRPAKPKEAKAPARPNVIFVLTDDLGFSDIGCYGATKVKTPHIDRLAANGMRFTDFHTAASICSPSRAAFLTGAYPQRAGLYMGINPIRAPHWFLGLNSAEITLAEQFKQRDYNTFMVGKWHLGTEPEFHPMTQGFDHYYGMPCNFAHSPKFFDDKKEVFARTPLERLTELYTQRATKIIRESGDEPFFLYYAHNYPHTPFKAGKRFAGKSKDGVRGDVMQELDWSIGEMMQALKDKGIAENTIVIFTSDNGPTKNEYAKPYRGTKYVTFEGGHRVPFIVHWPATIKRSSVSSVPINAMDLFPTLSQVIGADLPNDRTYDGESLVPLIQGQPLNRKVEQPFFYYNCENLQAVRVGEWKLHLPRTLEQIPFWEKNKAFTKLTQPVLYNLRTDHAEQHDVAAKHPDVVKRILAIATTARQELGEFMKRGSGQRSTGSVFEDVPIISHDKDWRNVDAATQQRIQKERVRRHGPVKPNKRGRKK